MNRFKKLALTVTAAGLLGGIAVAAPAQAAPVTTKTPIANGSSDGGFCYTFGACPSFHNVGATYSVRLDSKNDSIYAWDKFVKPGQYSVATSAYGIEGFMLPPGTCAWVRDMGTSKWTSYWGSKTSQVYVHMGPWDDWDTYNKPCGTSS